jgi:hypothetical protein
MQLSPPVPLPFPMSEAFAIGLLGALTGYIVLYRQTRLAEFAKNPRQNWKVLAFDLLLYLLGGGLVTTFLVTPANPKDAFIGGLGWQALVGGYVAGTELAAYKKASEKE